jgi:hypothetical protein
MQFGAMARPGQRGQKLRLKTVSADPGISVDEAKLFLACAPIDFNTFSRRLRA